MTSSRDHDLDELSGLAEAAQSGDRAALAALGRDLQHPVYRLAWRFCGDPGDAEDAAFEVMLRLLTTLGSYDSGRFTIWVYAGAVRQLVRSLPRSAESAAGRPGSAPAPMVELPREERIAYVLTDLTGFTVADGAEICAIDPETYEQRLAAARSRLSPSAGAADSAAGAVAPASIWSRLVATMPSRLAD